MDHYPSNGHAAVPSINTKGMSTALTGFFLAGEMAGSGILALPFAIISVGWVGFPLLLICCCGAAFSAVQLGKCWNILEQRWPEEFSGRVRYPYASIAYKAAGFRTRVFVSLCILVTLFGAAVVVLIQCSDFVTSLVQHSDWGVREILPVVAAAVLPILFLGTPKDFWPVGIAALMATSLACALILVQMIATFLKGSDTTRNDHALSADSGGSVSVNTFSLSFATILFSFGGASTFPTIQNDMREKGKFHVSVGMCFAILLALYLPVVIGAYLTLGTARTTDNVILSLEPGTLRRAASVLVSIHLFATSVVVLNPLCQELEEYLGVPENFTWKRCLFRFIVLALVVGVGEALPRFGSIMNLIGGSTITLCTFVFPSIFYTLLVKKCNSNPGSSTMPTHAINLHEAVAMVELVSVGVLGGAAATYSAVRSL